MSVFLEKVNCNIRVLSGLVPLHNSEEAIKYCTGLLISLAQQHKLMPKKFDACGWNLDKDTMIIHHMEFKHTGSPLYTVLNLADFTHKGEDDKATAYAIWHISQQIFKAIRASQDPNG